MSKTDKTNAKKKDEMSRNAQKCIAAAIPAAITGYAMGGPSAAARSGASACIRAMMAEGNRNQSNSNKGVCDRGNFYEYH